VGQTLRQAQGDNSRDGYKVKSTVTLMFSKWDRPFDKLRVTTAGMDTKLKALSH